jgi:hypothetical protein
VIRSTTFYSYRFLSPLAHRVSDWSFSAAGLRFSSPCPGPPGRSAEQACWEESPKTAGIYPDDEIQQLHLETRYHLGCGRGRTTRGKGRTRARTRRLWTETPMQAQPRHSAPYTVTSANQTPALPLLGFFNLAPVVFIDVHH